ncbi:MAG: hypothetical protein HC898_04800 [Phycisphaerales bacterium]|nr:hypothetical protein [Phycisphaerales bacterium]
MPKLDEMNFAQVLQVITHMRKRYRQLREELDLLEAQARQMRISLTDPGQEPQNPATFADSPAPQTRDPKRLPNREFIIHLLRNQGEMTSNQLLQVWRQDKRKTRLWNILNELKKMKRIQVTPIPNDRGSRYTLTAQEKNPS